MAIKGGKPYLAYTPLSHYIFCPVVKVVSTQFPPCVPAEIALISTLTRQVCTYQRLTYLLTLSTYRCADLTAEKDNCSFLISNSSLPQGRINPPIRGSIGETIQENPNRNQSQSPYKGFNRGQRAENPTHCLMRLNPPIRGSIANDERIR